MSVKLRLAWAGVGLAAAMGVAVACGSDKKDDDTSTSDKLTFSGDVEPILKTSCAGTGCHEAATTMTTAYVGAESAFKAAKASVKDRLGKAKTDALYMPKQDSQNKTLSDADKSTLLNFLEQ